MHPRYNPEKDGRPQQRNCAGCDALWVIHLYTGIARRKAGSGDGILISRPDTPSNATDKAATTDKPFQLEPKQQDSNPPDDSVPLS
jgi:hypothetical protein